MITFAALLLWHGDKIEVEKDKSLLEKKFQFYKSHLFEGLVILGFIFIIFWFYIIFESDNGSFLDVLDFILLSCGVIQFGVIGILIRKKFERM